jgi:HTH-type transcriptional regulator/antitoxin HipB
MYCSYDVKGISCGGMKALWLQTPAQLSSHLRSLRKARGLTQAALGELLGLDQTRVAKIERDPRRVSVGQLLQLLTVLRVRVLLELINDKPQSPVRKRPDW